MRVRLLMSGAVACLALTAVTACDPVPSTVINVTTTALGADSAPGDGTCASSAAAGACTLQAAIEEANAGTGTFDIHTPSGIYESFDATVTGDIRINPDANPNVTVSTSFTVAAGAKLNLTGLNTSKNVSDTNQVDLDVSGTAVVSSSKLNDVNVKAGGTMIMDRSAVLSVDQPAVVNSGHLYVLRSSLLANNLSNTASGVVLDTRPGGVTELTSSVIARPDVITNVGTFHRGGGGTCTGVAPVSHGNNFIETPCGSTPAPGDASGGAGIVWDVTVNLGPPPVIAGNSIVLKRTSPLIDAVPVGGQLCNGTETDLYGQVRGVDGNGGTAGGCDIGGVEAPDPLPADKAKPVLLIHGYAPILWAQDCSLNFNVMKRQLRAEGFTGPLIGIGYYADDSDCDVPLHQWGYYEDTGSWKEMSKALANYIKVNFTDQGQAVDIVGYSMGGLIARGAVYGSASGAPGFPGPINVDDVVTLGTPHNGTPYLSGLCAWADCAAMQPGSPDIAWLNQNGNPQGFRGTEWTAMGSDADAVVPVASALHMSIPPARLVRWSDVVHAGDVIQVGDGDYLHRADVIARTAKALYEHDA